MNEYDSERLARAFKDERWEQTYEEEKADLLLINTCTVRQLAEQKAFSMIGRWVGYKRQRPELLIGMVGCLAQHMAREALKRAPEIDFIAGPRALTSVPKIAEKSRAFKRVMALDDTGYGPGAKAFGPSGLLAHVAVMEGCNQFCAYCAVPYARGREMSRPVSDILAEVQQRLDTGAKEIMLLGQNVNHYGFDLTPRMDFSGLLRRIAELSGSFRIRFMTNHPKDFSDSLISAMVEIPQVGEALHLPLQSGSDAILASMRRGYTIAEYSALAARLRQAMPNLTLSTDIIVGFPGETQADFQATLDAVSKLQFDAAYCFKFSPRQGTLAAQLPNPVPQDVISERLNNLLGKVRDASLASQAVWLGRVEKVLVEELDANQPGRVKGRTRANRWVAFPGPEEWMGREVPVRIIASDSGGLWGEPVG